MFSFKSIALIAMALAISTEAHEVAVAAPLTVPTHVGYAHAVPQNLPPHAAQVSFYNRALAAPFVAPVGPVAAPLAAPVGPVPAPAPFAPFARYAAANYFGAPAPYFAGPAPVAAAPYALPAPAVAAPAPFAPAAYAAPYPYPGGFLRTPFGVGPAFVR
ncbi:hypothetical protein NE865_02520 [Phthorimaea operculella]|nr:hypothetical protein NE865_02520 [Phthorimaea operculella]